MNFRGTEVNVMETYVGVLGARLIATIGTPAFRQYFFEIGNGNSVAFFESQ